MSILDREQPDGAISGAERPGSPRQYSLYHWDGEKLIFIKKVLQPHMPVNCWWYEGSSGLGFLGVYMDAKTEKEYKKYRMIDEALREATGDTVLPRKEREEG